MSLEGAHAVLKKGLSGEVQLREPLARHTTYRLGGPADLFVTCDTISDLTLSHRVLAEEGLPYCVLGKGSNILAADDGYRGAVLVLGREFRSHEISEGHLRAGAGSILASLVQTAFSKGLTGMEFAVGVPGTVGGALTMNAGGSEDWIGDKVESVTLLVPEEGLVSLRGSEVKWGYRSSDLDKRGIVVECLLKVEQGEKESIRASMDGLFERRKASQPLGTRCAGSVFKNPPGDSAGRLIEASGMKGVRLGGAIVSEVHANFIINDGNGTASDVEALIDYVRAAVKETHGIELTTEVRFLGSFDAA